MNSNTSSVKGDLVMNRTGKIKKAAVILFVIFSILFFLQAAQKSIPYLQVGGFSIYSYSSTHSLIILLGPALFIGIYIICFLLVRTIIKNDTPFKKKTVTLLKIIALLFICIDVQGAIGAIYRNIQSRNTPSPEPAYTICEYTGGIVVITTLEYTVIWHGGFAVIAGLIIYLIALVLKHGISLQTQVDETL